MNMHKKERALCVAAGASGGHLIPALVIARDWKTANPDGKVLLWTSAKRLDKRVVQDFPFIDRIFTVNVAPFSLNPFKLIRCGFSIVVAYFRARVAMGAYKAEKFITTGGIISIPVAYAARRLSVPVVVYELNVVPGKATRMLAKGATEIKLTFNATLEFFAKRRHIAEKCEVVQYPIKFDAAATELPKAQALAMVNERIRVSYELEDQPLLFQPNRKTLFVSGGSQGSLCFNEFMRRFLHLTNNQADKIQIIHQIGDENAKRWQRQYQKSGIPALVFPYTSYMEECYTVADFVISRAGAGSLFELAFFGKKAMIVPLEGAAEDHQLLNAQAMAEQYPGLFTVVRQELFDGDIRKAAHRLYKLFDVGPKVESTTIEPAHRSVRGRAVIPKQDVAQQ